MRFVSLVCVLFYFACRAEVPTASELLRPLSDHQIRPVDWPSQITFKLVEKIDLRGFKALLFRNWDISYHCEGRPITARFLSGLEGGGDKYQMFMQRYDSRSLFVTAREFFTASNESGSTVAIASSSYDVASLDDGSYRVAYGGVFRDAIMQVVQIRETGEFGLSANDPRLPLCDGVHPLGVVLLPSDNLGS